MDTKDQARIMAIKQALVQTTNTPGWAYIKKMAANLVTKTTDEALDEEESTKRDAKVLKASALKKGFNELFNAIDATKNFTTESGTESDFEDLGEPDLSELAVKET